MTFPKVHAKAPRRKSPCGRPPKKFAALRLCVSLFLLSLAAVKAQTNGLSEAEIQGRELARQLCEARPTENVTNSGTIKIRTGGGKLLVASLKVESLVEADGWKNNYTAELTTDKDRFDYSLTVIHAAGVPTTYQADDRNFAGRHQKTLLPNQNAVPFAGSDFWLCDLGLEFFHWPQQKLLPKTTNLKRGREYTLLESTCPNPPTNGYSRVLTWIDKESGGILYAEAYDTQGKLLKEFEPKSFKKVNGQWELQEMEIRNVQTGSRTRLEFDLPK